MSCIIDDNDTMILTGGSLAPNKVSRFDYMAGWIRYSTVQYSTVQNITVHSTRYLPNLKEGRWGHGCASYVDTNNKTVGGISPMNVLLLSTS